MVGSTAETHRAEIALSWHRSVKSGLDPARPRVHIGEVERSSRLIVAATPVIEELADSMADYPFSVMLADELACIVSARFGDRTIARQIERNGGVPGRIFSEELTGTSSIGTVLELRRPLAVHGEEHYLESLKAFSCYGAPILHPITKRSMGLIDVTGLASGASPILGPLLSRAAKDVEARLLDLSRASEAELFRRYQERASRRRKPVLALGPDFTLANAAAADLVGPADYPMLRSLSLDPRAQPVRLATGAAAWVRIELVGARGDCLLLEIDQTAPMRHQRLRAAEVLASPQPGRRTQVRALVVGEPGTGRTSLALGIVGPGSSRHTAESALQLGEQVWLRGVARGLARGPCVVDDVDSLSPALAGSLARLLSTTPSAVAMTAGLRPPSSAEHSALMGCCPDRRTVPPLRERLDDLPRLVRTMTAEAGQEFELAPSALEALRAHDWPGNLHELRSVIAGATMNAMSGELTARDLPPAYRRTVRARRLGRLEAAERDTIVETLTESNGNISHAARLLGVSRPTLYNRIRALGIAR